MSVNPSHAALRRQLTLPDGLTLPNRVVMLPMTRARAEIDGTPNSLMARYYAQRAEAGLIIAEACPVAPVGRPFLNSPGMFTHDHALGWREVTEAVHHEGGRIMLQLNHSGRVNNLQFTNRPVPPVAPSAVRIPRNSRKITVNIPRVTPFEMPRALSTDEIELIILDFQHAARLARWAGFDGVQIHADSGYLLHQFLSTNVNRRSDRYGGSPQNRARLVLEVLDAIVADEGPQFVSIKLTPGLTVHEIEESDVDEKYPYLIEELNKRQPLAFLHLAFLDLLDSPYYGPLAAAFNGLVLADGSLDVTSYEHLLDSGQADLVGFGRAFIANPDLVTRLCNDRPLSTADQETIYSPGAEGYVDYPIWDPERPEASVVRLDNGYRNPLLAKQTV
jgi:N-ethylmaleimide reductase